MLVVWWLGTRQSSRLSVSLWIHTPTCSKTIGSQKYSFELLLISGSGYGADLGTNMAAFT